jgi:hypothetical protein
MASLELHKKQRKQERQQQKRKQSALKESTRQSSTEPKRAARPVPDRPVMLGAADVEKIDSIRDCFNKVIVISAACTEWYCRNRAVPIHESHWQVMQLWSVIAVVSETRFFAMSLYRRDLVCISWRHVEGALRKGHPLWKRIFSVTVPANSIVEALPDDREDIAIVHVRPPLHDERCNRAAEVGIPQRESEDDDGNDEPPLVSRRDCRINAKRKAEAEAPATHDSTANKLRRVGEQHPSSQGPAPARLAMSVN